MKKPIEFYKNRVAYALISVLSILALLGVTFFLNGGFRLGIDFQPGISMAVSVQGSQVEQVRQSLNGLPYSYTVQTAGGQNTAEYVIRAPIPGNKEDLLQDMEEKAVSALKARFGAESVNVLAVDYIGPSLSADLVVQTITLVLVVLLLMIIYITFRFRFGYAMGAVIALVHDVLFTLAFIGAMGIELSTAVVAALLTLIGYSINDTIVVYDRIRENIRLNREQTLPFILDQSITQSLSRTFVTSLTTLLVVVVLAIVTEGDVRNFSLSLAFGITVGTFSSITIASPVLPLFKSVKRDVAREQESYVKAQARV